MLDNGNSTDERKAQGDSTTPPPTKCPRGNLGPNGPWARHSLPFELSTAAETTAQQRDVRGLLTTVKDTYAEC